MGIGQHKGWRNTKDDNEFYQYLKKLKLKFKTFCFFLNCDFICKTKKIFADSTIYIQFVKLEFLSEFVIIVHKK